MDDEKIIQLLFARDETALPALEEKYGQACKKIAFNVTRSAADAEEACSDAMLGVWNSIPPNRPVHFFPYVAKVVRNCALKKARYNGAEKRRGDAVPFSELEECIPAALRTQEEVDVRQLARLVNKFLEGQDRATRVAFVKRYWYCESVREIASALGMRAHAVTSRLSRARGRLKEFLIEEGYSL